MSACASSIGDDPRRGEGLRPADRHSASICKDRSCGSARSEAAARDGRRRAPLSCSIPIRRPATPTRVYLPHPEIFAALEPGHTLLIDDGKVRLTAIEATPTRAVTRVEVGGTLVRTARASACPIRSLPFSALTTKDRSDLDAALDAGVDWIALSFIQRADDVAEAKKITRGRAGIMAKIEKPQAVTQIDEILELSDAIMVARGDLGVEMPLEQVPAMQKQLTRAARRAGKPVIVATQMLESMITSPVPTRAEVSDVATAIYEGADAVMLSAESAAGQYPVEAVSDDEPHRRGSRAAIRNIRTIINAQRAEPEATGADAIAAASRQIAETLDLAAIVCWTCSGATALRVARERPNTPIVAHLAEPFDRPQTVAGVGRALRGRRGRARSGRHGRSRLPPRLQGFVRACRPAHHHRRGRAARNARRDQHGAHRFRRQRRGGTSDWRASLPSSEEQRRSDQL